MTEKKLLLIVNPNSGDGMARRWVYDMLEILSARYPLITVYFSKCVGDIIRVTKENAVSFDAVVCCGGDGTLNETINGLIAAGSRAELGYIPTGTVNDFATSHGIPKNIKAAVAKIAAGEPREYDVGVLGERCFSYVGAFGAFTEVSYLTPQVSKASFGKAAYVAEAIKSLPELKAYHAKVTYDGKTEEGDFIYGMFSNSKTVGGIRFFGNSEEHLLSDGFLEMTLVRFPQTLLELQNAVTGLLTQAPSPSVIRAKIEKAEIVFSEETPFTADGEFGGAFTDVTVRNIPHGIRVVE